MTRFWTEQNRLWSGFDMKIINFGTRLLILVPNSVCIVFVLLARMFAGFLRRWAAQYWDDSWPLKRAACVCCHVRRSRACCSDQILKTSSILWPGACALTVIKNLNVWMTMHDCVLEMLSGGFRFSDSCNRSVSSAICTVQRTCAVEDQILFK